MPTKPALSEIDYLIVGHLSQDLTAEGPRVGGSVAYAGLTASALGMRVGALTAAAEDLDLGPVAQLAIECIPSAQSTTFDNRYTETGRIQTLLARAEPLRESQLPPRWRETPIVHLGPIADEVDLGLIDAFPDSLIGLTPQGWLRRWDQDGHIQLVGWEVLRPILPRAAAVVVSQEDLQGDVGAARAMAATCRLLAVTDGSAGATLYCDGNVLEISAHPAAQLDPTGAGDVFAAAFFVLLHRTGDAEMAARVAARLAALSVTRRGLAGVPTTLEVEQAVQAVRA
ncbi:MAG: PfkB family carbohydrate kinase [Actinobacteria bacterium]|nr:PfkB family carbohydrate kinase [Actinomycetota bacterium]